jgi:chromatin segregation and condensation protein Rec8/ScpA/Scc1 (kleisin family)
MKAARIMPNGEEVEEKEEEEEEEGRDILHADMFHDFLKNI